MPVLGDVLPLSFQTLDQAAGLYVRALLKKPDGSSLAGSPVAMDDIGDGKYTSDAIVMPDEDYIECTYEPYIDAAYTTPSDHLVGTDVFRQEIPDSVIVDKLDQIINILNSLALPGAMIDVKVAQNIVRSAVEELEDVRALVDPAEAVVRTSKEDQGAVVNIDEDELVVKKDCG